MRLESFAHDISEVRHKRGLGVRLAAKQAGVSAATISRIENRNMPDIEIFERLCLWGKLRPLKYLDFKSVSQQGEGT